jgi:hypothetical protein
VRRSDVVLPQKTTVRPLSVVPKMCGFKSMSMMRKPHQAQKRIKGALFKNIRREETFLDTVKRCYATTESRNIFLAGM